MKNPKSHDALFKWLIATFISDFFEHYFPGVNVKVGKDPFLDKEFISKYEALKASLEGDLFIIVEVDIDGKMFDVVVHIETQSSKKDMSSRVFEYLCYAWLLKQRPVWSIVFYTDDAKWRTEVPSEFFYAFNSKLKKQNHRFDIIKINQEKSADLIKKHSLMCKLLALKADDTGIDRDQIIREIYQAAENMRDQLTNDHFLLIHQFVGFYKNISEKQYEKIRQEVHMTYYPPSISEYYRDKWETEGEKKGEKKGEIRGEIKGEIKAFEKLYRQKVLTKNQYTRRVNPLKKKLAQLS